MDASACGQADRRISDFLRVGTEAPPIGDHADDGTHAKELFFGGRLVQRDDVFDAPLGEERVDLGNGGDTC